MIGADWSAEKRDFSTELVTHVDTFNANPVNPLLYVQDFQEAAALPLNLLLEKGDGVNELLRARRATGNIHIHWNHLVYSLNQRIILKHPAGSRASAH